MATRRPRKSVLIALKVDAETAAALEGVANKSEFIREALRARLEEACPLCSGTGRRPSTSHAQPGRRHLHALPRARCGDCGREGPVLSEHPGRERLDGALELDRLKTFLAFGDYFCAGCYGRSQECDRCGHRVPGTPLAKERHACAR